MKTNMKIPVARWFNDARIRANSSMYRLGLKMGLQGNSMSRLAREKTNDLTMRTFVRVCWGFDLDPAEEFERMLKLIENQEKKQ